MLSVTGRCREATGDGTSMLLRFRGMMVNIAHFEIVNRANTPESADTERTTRRSLVMAGQDNGNPVRGGYIRAGPSFAALSAPVLAARWSKLRPVALKR